MTDNACVAYLGRDAQGISFALADAPDDLDFAFFGLSEGAPVAYRLFAADALGLVYCNYCRYEPMMGRWLSRDPYLSRRYGNLLAFVQTEPIYNFDYIGLVDAQPCAPGVHPDGQGDDGYKFKNLSDKEGSDERTGKTSYEEVPGVIKVSDRVKASGKVDLNPLKVQKLINRERKEWEREKNDQFLHKGADWDEWRSKKLPTETSRESW